MDNKKVAEEVIKKVGGKSNITQAWHCFTRLRFNLVDKSKADLSELKQINGVLNAQFQGNQLQVIVGNSAGSIYEELKEMVGDTGTPAAAKKEEKQNPLNVVFDTISGIFNPMLAAITSAGLLKGILSLLLFIGVISDQSSEYLVLNMISDATFYFLPFLLAFSAARKFKTNEFVAVSLAGILMYPSFAALVGTEESIRFFFLKIPVLDYSGSVLPIILGVLLLSVVYRFIDKHMPKMLRLIFTPLLSLLVVAPIVLFIVAPIGNYLGEYLAEFFKWLFDVAGPVAGLLMGGFMPFIVMAGMHYALFPVAFDSIGRLGYDIMLLPMSLVNNMAQCAATLAVAIKTKDKDLRSLAFSSSLSALFGITEPAMYGVTLKLKKPLYAAMIGSGIGGAIYGFFTVKIFTFTIPGITALPSFISSSYTSNFLFACIGVVVSMVVAFVLTMLFSFESAGDEKEGNTIEPEVVASHADTTPVFGEEAAVLAPVSGKTIPLGEMKDDVFAGEVLGKGVGILPDEDVIRAPFNGTISMVADTGHALGLTSDAGVDLLIHVGINTVSMQGEGFETFVTDGQRVSRGQKLLKFDAALIAKKGFSVDTAVIVTNSDEYKEVISDGGRKVKACEDKIIKIVN